MRELRTGLWHWDAPHPDWKPGRGAGRGFAEVNHPTLRRVVMRIDF